MAKKSLGTLTLDLVAQTGGFVQGMDKAERKSKKFRDEISRNLKKTGQQLEQGLKVSAAAAAAGIAALTAATIQQTRAGLQNIDAQNKLARSLDASFDSVTALSLAFSENGIDGYEMSLARLNRRLGAAENGSGEAAKTVEALNLNLSELSGLDADERLARIADAIVKSGASAQQAARYAQQLGFEQKEAAQMFLQGGDAIRAYRKQVDEFGLSVSAIDAIKVEQANDAFARTGLVLDAVSQQLAIQVAPILSGISEMFVQNAKDAGGVGEATADAFNMVIEASAEAVNGVSKMDRQFLRTKAALDVFALEIRNGFLEIAREIVEIPTAAVNELIITLNAFGANIEPLGLSDLGKEVQGLVNGTKAEIENINADLAEELAKPLPGDQFKRFVFEARAAAEESAEAMAKIQEAAGLNIGGDSGGNGAGGNQDLEKELQDRVETIRQAFESEKHEILRIYGERNNELQALYEADALTAMEFDNLKFQNEQQKIESITQLHKDNLEKREEAEAGYWERWIESAADNLQNFDYLSKTVIDNFTTGFGNAFESVIFDAESLDDAFKGIAETILRSVVNAIGQMAAQWLALQAVQAVVGTSATAATVGQAAVASAAWSTPAALASLATAGANAVPASAAIVSTTSLAKGLSLAGMAHDGIDTVPQEGTWLLDKGERVMSSPQADDLDAFLSSQKMNNGGSAPIINVTEAPGQGGMVEPRQNQDGQWVVDIMVEQFGTNGRGSKAAQSAFGLKRQGY